MPQPRPLHERVPPAQAIRWMNIKRRTRFKRRVPWQKLLTRIDAPHRPAGTARFAAWTREKIGVRSPPRPTQGVFEVKVKGRGLFFMVGVGRDLRERAVKLTRARKNREFVGGKEEARRRVLEELGVDALHAVARPPVLGRGRTAFLAEGEITWDEGLARQAARQAAHGFGSTSRLGEPEIAEFVSSALKAYEEALLERTQRERLRAERAVRREVGLGTQEGTVNGGGRTDAPASKAPGNGGNGQQARNPRKRKKRNGAVKPVVPLSRRRPLAFGARHFYKPYEEALEAMRDHRPRLVQQAIDRHSQLNGLIRNALDRALTGLARNDLSLRRKYAWAVIKFFWSLSGNSRNRHAPLDFFIDKTGGRHLPGSHIHAVMAELVTNGILVDHAVGQNHSYELNYDHPVVRAVQG